MLKIQILELSGCGEQNQAYSLYAENNKGKLLKKLTSKELAENSIIGFENLFFFVPLRDGSVVIGVQEDKTTHKLNLGTRVLEAATKVQHAVRRFPIRETCLMLKLKLTFHAYMIPPQDNDGNVSPRTPQGLTIEARYKRLLETLSKKCEEDDTPNKKEKTSVEGKKTRPSAPPKKQLPTLPTPNQHKKYCFWTGETKAKVTKVFVKGRGF